MCGECVVSVCFASVDVAVRTVCVVLRVLVPRLRPEGDDVLLVAGGQQVAELQRCLAPVVGGRQCCSAVV